MRLFLKQAKAEAEYGPSPDDGHSLAKFQEPKSSVFDQPREERVAIKFGIGGNGPNDNRTRNQWRAI